MKENECNLEKQKHQDVQHSFSLALTNYLPHAQLLLGSAVRIGICCMVNCKIGKQHHAVTVHRVQSSDVLNYVSRIDL
jgi:hypothetical protein